MAEVKAGRWTADIEGDFVVFLIGARADKRRLLRSFRDLGGRRGMLHMLQHLSAHPEKGLLGYEMSTLRRDHRAVLALVRAPRAVRQRRDDPHVAAWRNYWQRVGKDTRTGIWHETYLVRAGEYEAIYGNMPPFGLGKASSLVTLAEGRSARGRLKRRTAT